MKQFARLWPFLMLALVATTRPARASVYLTLDEPNVTLKQGQTATFSGTWGLSGTAYYVPQPGVISAPGMRSTSSGSIASLPALYLTQSHHYDDLFSVTAGDLPGLYQGSVVVNGTMSVPRNPEHPEQGQDSGPVPVSAFFTVTVESAGTPEPASIMLLGPGLALAAARRRRARRARMA